MASHPILNHLGAIGRVIGRRAGGVWRRYRALRPRYQILIALGVLILFIVLTMILRGGGTPTAIPLVRAVTLSPVAELSGNGSGASVLGTVRSVTEADILAEASGTVRRVNARIGSSVPAGYVIAELENDAQRATVLQAEGAYDSALASRASVSPVDAATAATNAYRSAFSALDATLENDVDDFFGAQTPVGPDWTLTGESRTDLSRERMRLEQVMGQWSNNLADADRRDPETLLDEAASNAYAIQAFVEDVAEAANQSNTDATTEQLATLASARAAINATITTLTSAQATYRSGSTGSTASVDAGVKSALGNLRLAQANLEKTIIRAPIAGTVNFLPIRVGDYVSALQHVSTVAQNGALEVLAYVSEEERSALSVGTKVTIDTEHEGIVTTIAPALDPNTRQIEVRIAVTAATGPSLVNGQSVRVGIPGASVSAEAVSGPILLPLASVKLRAEDRIVFSVIDGALVAHHVEIGEVRGDRIEILTELPADLRIVTDARGLAEGEQVRIAE